MSGYPLPAEQDTRVEERLRLMEETYASLIAAFSSLESRNDDDTLPK